MISITSNKTAWSTLKTKLIVGVTKELQIGFFKESNYGVDNNNLPVALVAAWQDKGAPFVGDKHIPARPFMTQGLRSLLKSSVYTSKYKKSFVDILLNNSSFEKEYKKMGLQVVPALKKIIDRWAIPPNAAETVAKKGKNDPLIDTGKMRDSVKAKVRKSR